MKINQTIKSAQQQFTMLMLLAFFFVSGCTRHTNPLEGWKRIGTMSNVTMPEVIKQDATTYIQNLPPKTRPVGQLNFLAQYLQDASGQHAVEITTPHDGEYWTHGLIYDQSGRRIKVLMYSSGSYMD